MRKLRVALVSLCLLASPSLLASPASAAGSYSTGSVSMCPSYAPYYKVSWTGYAVCSRYP